jgi:hypothetical protein
MIVRRNRLLGNRGILSYRKYIRRIIKHPSAASQDTLSSRIERRARPSGIGKARFHLEPAPVEDAKRFQGTVIFDGEGLDLTTVR